MINEPMIKTTVIEGVEYSCISLGLDDFAIPKHMMQGEKQDGYIYKDAVDSEVIRIIDNTHIDMIETYIREHYCEKAKAVQIDEINGYNVYKIISE